MTAPLVASHSNNLAPERGCVRFPAKLWLGLPQPWTMFVAHAGGQTALITTRAADYRLACSRRWPAAAGDEWLLLARAAEQRRAALAIEQWLSAEVWTDDPWRMRPQPLAACIGPSDMTPIGPIATGEVLGHFRCELIALDPDLTMLGGTA